MPMACPSRVDVSVSVGGQPTAFLAAGFSFSSLFSLSPSTLPARRGQRGSRMSRSQPRSRGDNRRGQWVDSGSQTEKQQVGEGEQWSAGGVQETPQLGQRTQSRECRGCRRRILEACDGQRRIRRWPRLGWSWPAGGWRLLNITVADCQQRKGTGGSALVSERERGVGGAKCCLAQCRAPFKEGFCSLGDGRWLCFLARPRNEYESGCRGRERVN